MWPEGQPIPSEGEQVFLLLLHGQAEKRSFSDRPLTGIAMTLAEALQAALRRQIKDGP